MKSLIILTIALTTIILSKNLKKEEKELSLDPLEEYYSFFYKNK